MEDLKRARRPVRRDFQKLEGELEALLKEPKLRKDAINVKFKLFNDANDQLHTHDDKIIHQLSLEKATEADENKEWDEIADFKLRAETMRQLKEKKCPTKPPQAAESINGGSNSTGEVSVRNFKLPTVQLKKFSGKLEDWLGFWAQFQKIDEDQQMLGSDKFLYLLQSLEPGTDAHELATGYPLSNANYPIVIEALKKQYASEDLQLQVYIRKLLKLVISNVDSKDKLPVKNLFLKLDSHLRALKTLNLEKADPATWLYPLVESCLPETILGNWQRSGLASHDGSKDDPPRTRLDLLMSFVGKEVEIQQRIEMARSFATDQQTEQRSKIKSQDLRNRERKQERGGGIPTLSSFHAGDLRKCVFCTKTNHNSGDCFRAKNMRHEDKIEILKKRGLCFRCTGQHLAVDCKERVECSICKKSHLTVLCRESRQKRDRDSYDGGRYQSGQYNKKPRVEGEVKTTTSSANVECSSEVALKTVRVRLRNGNNEVDVRAFIDEGCQRSYILTSTARKLNLEPVGMEKVIHSLFGAQKTTPVVHNLYEIKLESLNGEFTEDVRIRDQARISETLPRVTERYPALRDELREMDVTLSDEGKGKQEIELLIGADLYPRLMTGEIRKLRSGAIAILTRLGWTLMGEITTSVVEGSMTYVAMSVAEGGQGLIKLWELGTIGINDPSEEITKRKRNEIEIVKFQENLTRNVDGKYSVRLPWKENLPWLPSNREVAFKRLECASRKLWDKGLYHKYDTIFCEWEKEGFIERVEGNGNMKVHYLPHRPVVKDSMTTPVRPVFDASCRVGKSPSLNDCLFTGESTIQMIPDLLQRFRLKKVGFVADIRKAFQMVEVEEGERDWMRFLWWKDERMQEIIEYRHARVLFGATCSPFILAAVIYHHLTQLPEEQKEIGRKLLSTLYVDNCVHSEDSVANYHLFREEATEIMRTAGMDLRMWLSNVDEFENEETHVISVLGMKWDRKLDEIFVNVKGIKQPERVTKRTVLSTVQKIFDPLGFTCPATLQMKLLLQRTWSCNLKWDEELPEKEKWLFQKWCGELGELEKIKIPRLSSAGECDRGMWQLHVFSDASQKSFSCSVFLRVKNKEGVNVTLLSAKSRVAPIKPMTIPKLELTGCLIGARLNTSVKMALGLTDVKEYYWTDSLTALAWIRRDDQWGTYVANRTREINRLSDKGSWRHVPGVENPADLPSRGCSPAKLLESRWWEGPAWLYKDENEWPCSNEEPNEEEVKIEKRKSAPKTEVVSCCVSRHVQNSHTFHGLIRITAWARRFLHNKFVRSQEEIISGDLRTDELQRAEIIFLRNLQREEFPVEERGRLNGLEIMEDEYGVLRVKTRLLYRDDPPTFKFPILLPSKREEVKQLIRDYHNNYCHAGVGFLVTKLRQKYWILKARHTVKNVVSKCLRCRRYSAKAVVPEAAPLPLDRVKNAEVFEVTGVDLAGPLLLKNGKKAWVVIFTCAVYRAVHLELVTKVSTGAFIAALGKFVEKYRRPAVMYSDNGTNFRGADNLFKGIDWGRIEKNEKTSKIVWKFNPVTSSWWGGWWERLIRTAKDLLRRTVGKRCLDFNELKGAINKIADVMNQRPLTYVSENPEDLEPLTPALFLHPHGNVNFPEKDLSQGQELTKRYQYVTKLKEELRTRFLNEYLSMLVNRSPKKVTRMVGIGELVLVGSDNVKRIEWPLGKVLELIQGNDNEIRLARVKTEKGIIVRSVQRLFPLEMDNKADVEKLIRDKGVTTRSGRQVKAPNQFV